METVKIVRPECPGGFCVINKSDFEEGKHELYAEGGPRDDSQDDADDKDDRGDKPGRQGKRR